MTKRETAATAAVGFALIDTAVTDQGTGGRNIWEMAGDALRKVY